MKHINLSREQLIAESLKIGEGELSKDGALSVITGKHTGRAANDKFIVYDNQTRDTVNWDNNNKFNTEWFDNLYGRILAYLQDRDVYAQNLCVGTEVKLPFKLTTTSPRHAAGSLNMFYDESGAPQFKLIHVPDFKADPEIDHTNSDAFVVINFSKRIVLIGGTNYFGEIKKSMFTVMNFILPQLGVLPMHASVNESLFNMSVCLNETIDTSAKSCVFFGLSGTGKTTLSADPNRVLVGDDEHGWGKNGLFNFENGCYAKTINLNENDEPEIWKAVNSFGSILENVDMHSGEIDFNSKKYTENTRCSYKLSNISNASNTRMTGHPDNIIMLTYDSFGVLPLVSKLTVEQSYKYFLMGYTSKISGTEIGVLEPQATFSSCFGAPFLPLKPEVYGKLFVEKLNKYKPNVYLVNTGLMGGGPGVGKRVSIKDTRLIINHIVNNQFDSAKWLSNNVFDLQIPVINNNLENIVFNPATNDLVNKINKNGTLDPRDMWNDKVEYDMAASELCGKFKAVFSKYNA